MANIEVTISPAENPAIPEEEEANDGGLKEACNIQNLFELDDFEQFSARASSGGSLYGVLRKQALLQALGADATVKSNTLIQQEFLKRSNFLCPPGPVYHQRHNRSKSLVHRKQTLTDDKSILKYLYDYSENLKSGNGQPTKTSKYNVPDIRRHSEATMNCRLFIQSGNLTPEVIDEVTSKLKSSLPAFGDQHLVKFQTGKQDPAISVPQTNFPGKIGRQNRLQSLHGASSQNRSIPSVSVCRRRSFSIRQNEIRNEGDEMLFVPMVPSNSDDICSQNPIRTSPTQTHSSRRKSSKSWKESSLRRRSSAKPASYNERQTFGIYQDHPTSSSEANSGQVNYATEAEDAGKSPLELQNLYRVLMLGGPGVGKTALTQQFLTSEFMAAQNTSFDDCVQVTVPVLLDGDSIFVEFVDLPYNGDTYQWRDFGDVDGYVVVFSIIDRRSFSKAVQILDEIKCHHNSSRKTVILVANKNDLERSRLIGKQEGRNAAESRDCKYIDVSAILNHKVDDLLVGVLKQMRDFRRLQVLKTDPSDREAVDRSLGKCTGDALAEKMASCFATSKHVTAPRSENLWAKLIRKKSWRRILSKSCENLL